VGSYPAGPSFDGMAAPSRVAFRAELAALSVDERARFVADLWRARGRTARIEEEAGIVVVCPERDDRRRRLLVDDTGRRWLPSVRRGLPDGVDAVVTARAGRPRWVPAGVAVIDGDALYERAVHGVGGVARERLFREYFGPSPFDGPEGRAVDATERRRRHAAAVVAVVALAVIATAVAGIPGAPAGDRPHQSFEGEGGGETSTPFVGSTAEGTTADASTADATTPLPADAYPPGVNASGIVDGDALVDAHLDALEGREYRLVLTYAEYDRNSRADGPRADGTGPSGRRRLVATVDPPSRARTSVSLEGHGFGIADPVPWTETYVVGETIYRRVPRNDGTRYRRTSRPGTGSANATAPVRAYLRGALEVDASRLLGTTVVNGTRLFEIGVRGDDDPRTGYPRGRLVVDDGGVVRSFTREYTPNASVRNLPPGVVMTVDLRYVFENVTVEPPPWFGEAERALGENDSAFVPTGAGENRTAAASRGTPRTAKRQAEPDPSAGGTGVDTASADDPATWRWSVSGRAQWIRSPMRRRNARSS